MDEEPEVDGVDNSELVGHLRARSTCTSEILGSSLH
jgi:hypothetical protein